MPIRALDQDGGDGRSRSAEAASRRRERRWVEEGVAVGVERAVGLQRQVGEGERRGRGADEQGAAGVKLPQSPHRQ